MSKNQFGYVPHADMPEPLYLGPLSQRNLDALYVYKMTAGSFSLALITAFEKADGNNKAKLLDTFPWLFVIREDMIAEAETWWEEYNDENRVCETCDGDGSYLDGHYADPNSREVTCPDCDTQDPDTRDR